MSVSIVRLMPGDVGGVMQASELFDNPPRVEQAQKALDDPNHFLLMAYENNEPAGFVTGVTLTHPDKGTEMFVYELSVGEQFRGRGIAKSLVSALAEEARSAGCYGMWALTDKTNEAALRTYKATGAGSDLDAGRMLIWDFTSSDA